MNREQWLTNYVAATSHWYDDPLPPVRLGVGFTSKGARSKRVGECWTTKASDDGTAEIFIHPQMVEPLDVAAVVAHELIHAAIGHEAKHGPLFKRVAIGLGLEGKMTATEPGPLFVERVTPILAELGPYPHAALKFQGEASTGPKQTTRLLKVACTCGYTVRMARKWLDEVGPPTCPACEMALVEE